MKLSSITHFLCMLLFIHIGGMGIVSAQETFPFNSTHDQRMKVYAFTNAVIVQDWQNTLQNGTLIIRDGKVESVGTNVPIPADATVVDLKGKYIYPSFIDLHSHYGMPKMEKGAGWNFSKPEQVHSATTGAYNANQAIKAEFKAAEIFKTDKKKAKELRAAGFGSVLTFRPDGVARGSSAFVSLGEDNENLSLLLTEASAQYAFDRGSSSQLYPISTMGFVALLRQTYMDAAWYEISGHKEFTDLSLEAFNNQQLLPQIFSAKNYADVLRADRVGDEFGRQYIIKAGGDEYQRIDEVKSTNASLIVPLNFPKAYEVNDIFEAKTLSLKQMKHWEMAPTNPASIEKAGIEMSLTASGLDKPGLFLKQLRKAVEYGLSESGAIKALTENPASWLGINDKVGSLKEGMLANFFISSENIFQSKAVINEHWIQGKKYLHQAIKQDIPEGKYTLTVDGKSYPLGISQKKGKSDFQVYMQDTLSLSTEGHLQNNFIQLSFALDTAKNAEKLQLSGWKTSQGYQGEGLDAEGNMITWQAEFVNKEDEKDEDDKPSDQSKTADLPPVTFPMMAYGLDKIPTQSLIHFKNATVWTNEEQGILQKADVIIKDGKIVNVGTSLNTPAGAEVIDANGMHLTSGIIDEHSHIALHGVNDVATISSMVRMSDVVNAEDINVYRQLAGGVTAAQLLHGSANPVGGQSALIKFRWGSTAEEMLIKDADQYIKFALGENVKRSSWPFSRRYPQTRMGVEQIFRDAFQKAKEYDEKWKAYNALSKKAKLTTPAPRRDLQMEALAEIINKERFISCHSYVQSEINMLMKVAEDFDFRINTFTHILEGYKVADKMAKHGVGGSTFADWWAYKFEVYEAIPYNASLMTDQGVVTAINSDDAEMGRRLNQEAAKSVKYGNMSEEEAWKMVTLNPAKLLHLDDHMGSIKVGKDADLVLWTDNPLSIYAKASMTLVDGKVLYSMEQDKEHRKTIAKERLRLLNKMKSEKEKGEPTQSAAPVIQFHWHCDDLNFHEQR